MGGVISRGEEVHAQAVGRVPGGEVRQADAIIERQPARGLPCVLEIPFEVQAADVLDGPRGAFLVGIVTADNGVSVGIAGIERVIDVVGEIEGALVRERAGVCNVPAAVEVDAALEGMSAADYGK